MDKLSLAISFLTLMLNGILSFKRSLPNIKILQTDEKYSGTAINRSDYIRHKISDRWSNQNGMYTSCVIVELLITNNSSLPITITKFSSKDLRDMTTTSKNYGIIAGVGKEKNPDIIPLRYIQIDKNEYFSLPITIQPYGAVQKRIQLFATNKQIDHYFNETKKIKIKAHTNRNKFCNSYSKLGKVTVKNFHLLAKNDDSYSDYEHALGQSESFNYKNGDGMMINPDYILRNVKYRSDV